MWKALSFLLVTYHYRFSKQSPKLKRKQNKMEIKMLTEVFWHKFNIQQKTVHSFSTYKRFFFLASLWSNCMQRHSNPYEQKIWRNLPFLITWLDFYFRQYSQRSSRGLLTSLASNRDPTTPPAATASLPHPSPMTFHSTASLVHWGEGRLLLLIPTHSSDGFKPSFKASPHSQKPIFQD